MKFKQQFLFSVFVLFLFSTLVYSRNLHFYKKQVKNTKNYKQNLKNFNFLNKKNSKISVIWTRKSSSGIYSSSYLTSYSKGFAFSGTALSDDFTPKSNPVELTTFSGETKYINYYQLNQVSFSRHGKTGISVTYNPDHANSTIQMYTLPSTFEKKSNNFEQWKYKIERALPSKISEYSDGRSFSVMNNGLKMATLFQSYDGIHSKLLIFSSTTGNVPISSWFSNEYHPNRVIIDKEKGEKAFVSVNTKLKVLDITKQKAIELDSFEGDQSEFDFSVSPNNKFLVFGFFYLNVYYFDSKTQKYKKLFIKRVRDGMVINNLAISNNGNLVVGLSTVNYREVGLSVYNVLKGSDPKWTFNYGESYSFEDTVSSIKMTDDGQYFIVGNWGNQTYSNMQTRVFRFNSNQSNNNNRNGNEYFVTGVNMPGSVLSVDIMKSKDDKVLNVLTGCKNSHVNQPGKGGTLMFLKVDL